MSELIKTYGEFKIALEKTLESSTELLRVLKILSDEEIINESNRQIQNDKTL